MQVFPPIAIIILPIHPILTFSIREAHSIFLITNVPLGGHRSHFGTKPKNQAQPANSPRPIYRTKPRERFMTTIHPSAIVAPNAVLGHGVTVGPFCVVESSAVIGDRCKLDSHVVIKEGTNLGSDNLVHEGAVLGGRAQHLRAPNSPGNLTIGCGNTIRENVTIHRALSGGERTLVGDANLIMVGAHVAHDCDVGNHCVIANNTMLAGHVTVGDRAYLSGAVALHQFCRVGSYAMVGGQALITLDVPPYVTVDGKTSQIVGLNQIGMRRNGFRPEEILQLKAAYRLIYRSGRMRTEVLDALKEEFPSGPAAAFHPFLSTGTRGFIQERRSPRTTTLRLVTGDDNENKMVRKAG